MISIPKFILNNSEYKELLNNNLVYEIKISNFTLKPVEYINIKHKDISKFYEVLDNYYALNEATKKDNDNNKRTFAVKMVAHIFSLMKSCKTPSDQLQLINIIISLFAIDQKNSLKLLQLIKIPNYNVSDKVNQKDKK